MNLRVVLEYPGGNVPNLLASVLTFEFTKLEVRPDHGCIMVQAKCYLSSGNDVCDIHMHSSVYDWYWMRPVAVHLHLGSADAKLFVGTRRYDHKRRLVWYEASPRETCPCSSCVSLESLRLVRHYQALARRS
jgi:hypothetical protein